MNYAQLTRFNLCKAILKVLEHNRRSIYHSLNKCDTPYGQWMLPKLCPCHWSRLKGYGTQLCLPAAEPDFYDNL